VLFNKVITPSLTVRVSQRDTNVIESFEDVNSGGIWAYLSPGIIFQFNSTLSLMAQGDLPIFRNVNGFQLIPSYIIRGGILISF